jgi:hypothetical protein
MLEKYYWEPNPRRQARGYGIHKRSHFEELRTREQRQRERVPSRNDEAMGLGKWCDVYEYDHLGTDGQDLSVRISVREQAHKWRVMRSTKHFAENARMREARRSARTPDGHHGLIVG